MKKMLFLLILFFITPNMCKPMEEMNIIDTSLQEIQKTLTKWEFRQLNEFYNNKPDIAKPIIRQATENLAKQDTSNSEYDFFGRTPLHIAIARGELSTVESLLAGGINANAKTLLGQTALHYTILSKKMLLSSKLTTLKLLAKYPYLEIDRKDIFGATSLIYATQLNHEEIFSLLVTLGADIYLPGNNGNTPLHWAAYAHNTPVCILLIKKAADDNNDYKIAPNLQSAVPYNKLFEKCGNPPHDLVDILDPNNHPLTPIIKPHARRFHVNK